MRLALIALLILTACGRPLTPNELSFAAGLHGDTLDPAPVRIHATPLLGRVTQLRPPRPRIACRERIGRPETAPVIATSTAAVVLFDHVFYATPVWRPDFLAGYPGSLELRRAMTLAHELTHVWQWQNREITGYHPLRAAAEHRPGGDPYLFDLAQNRGFLDFDYEQQGALVEEYVCCRALAPEAARTERLRALLAPYFPQLRRRDPPAGAMITLPSDEADLDGICD